MKDATADYSDEEMHAALDVNLPNYASALVTTDEIIDSLHQEPMTFASTRQQRSSSTHIGIDDV